MDKITVKCGSCGATIRAPVAMQGMTRSCPSCQAKIRIEAAPSAEATSGGTPSFPERMKANRALTGRTCPICGHPIELGDDVYNCSTCNKTMHQACRPGKPGCGNPFCSTLLGQSLAAGGASAPAPQAQAARGAAAVSAPPAQEAGDGPTLPCKYCGEEIKVKARKCRFCGEYQKARDRDRMKRVQEASEASGDLTAAEWLVAILCSGIGCILGILWMIQGNPKGGKMFLVSLASSLVQGVLRASLEG